MEPRKRIVVRHVAVELLGRRALRTVHSSQDQYGSGRGGQLPGGGSCHELLLESVIGHI